MRKENYNNSVNKYNLMKSYKVKKDLIIIIIIIIRLYQNLIKVHIIIKTIKIV